MGDQQDERLELRRGKPDRLPYFDVCGNVRTSSHQHIIVGEWVMAIPPNSDRKDWEKQIAIILEDAERKNRAATAKRKVEDVDGEESGAARRQADLYHALSDGGDQAPDA